MINSDHIKKTNKKRLFSKQKILALIIKLKWFLHHSIQSVLIISVFLFASHICSAKPLLSSLPFMLTFFLWFFIPMVFFSLIFFNGFKFNLFLCSAINYSPTNSGATFVPLKPFFIKVMLKLIFLFTTRFCSSFANIWFSRVLSTVLFSLF